MDTSGWHAAVELGAAMQILAAAASGGLLLPARLRLEQRTQKRPGEPTRNFAVPVLDVDVTPAQLVAGVTARPALIPVPVSLERPVPSIAAQVAAAAEPLPARKGGQPPIPVDPELDAFLDETAHPPVRVVADDDMAAPFIMPAGQGLVCPACGSEVTDNRSQIEAGQLSTKHPKFKCSNRACEGVTGDGVMVTDGKAGEPWVTWHTHYFDTDTEMSDRPEVSTLLAAELGAHIAAGAVTSGKVLTVARTVCAERGETQPSQIVEVWELDASILDLVADRVADWIADQETT